jgi:predicted permease
MKALREFFSRTRDLFRRRSIAQAFEEERAFHLAELERQHRERGASPEEARQAAARAFGNDVLAREALRAQAGFPSWDELAGDVRHALRGILRRPALACSVILILTLGLGAAATIHGLIDAVFLRPLPVPHPEQLQAVVPLDPRSPNRVSRGTVRRLEEALPENSVAGYARAVRATVQLTGQDSLRAGVRLVTGSFFSALEIKPQAGRLLRPSDDVIGAPERVAVVGYAWAKKNFGQAESAVGRSLTVNRVPITIVGVLPEAFREVDVGQSTDLWMTTALHLPLLLAGNASITNGNDRPNDPDWNREERVSWLQVLVRRHAGAPPLAAAWQNAWAVQRDNLVHASSDPRDSEGARRMAWTVVDSPSGQSRFRDSFRSTGRLLAGVVIVMLVLVCTNVSGLLLVRAMSRHREFGVRLALGAGSVRVTRLGFIEAALLSAGGAVGGCLLATWLLPVAAHLLAPNQDLEVSVGLRSLLAMSAAALVVAVLSALAPAFWISRVEPLRALSGNRGLGRVPVRMGRALVAVQFALAVALVSVAAALGSELQRLLAADPGFAREQVMTALFDPASAGYQDEAVTALSERFRQAVLGVSGVQSVSFSGSGILSGSRSVSGMYFRDPKVPAKQWSLQHDVVRPGYFGVVGMPLRLGRDFTDSDVKKSLHVAVINSTLAHDVFGDANPIGQRFGFDTVPTEEDMTIVGVVADVKGNALRESVAPMFYMSSVQWGEGDLSFLAVRFTGPATGLQDRLRAALARVEPGVVFTSWKTLEQRMSDDVSGDVATTRLAAIFGGCALILAGAGVAGSLGYLVILRQRELALRMAIGAAAGQILRSVLLDALRLSAIGGAIGLIAVWLVPFLPVVRATLQERPGAGPALLAAAVALVTATIAGWIPARRAARIDPILLLKSD